MNKHTHEMISRIVKAGISDADAWALRRISMTLTRWYELECGSESGYVERDESGKCWLITYNQRTGKEYRHKTADRETGALKRLDAIMKSYPKLSAYVQTDPRGASIYIIRPGDVPEGGHIESYYSNGVAVYK